MHVMFEIMPVMAIQWRRWTKVSFRHISNWLYENAELMTSLSRHREPLSSFYLGVLTI